MIYFILLRIDYEAEEGGCVIKGLEFQSFETARAIFGN